MANTPSLNASRRFFLCLIVAGLSARPSRLPRPRRPAPRGAGADPRSNDGGRAALPAARPPSLTRTRSPSSGGLASFFLWCLAPKACLSSSSCSAVRLERTSVASVPSTAARNLSSVIWLMMRNQPALPGGMASPICSRTCCLMPVLPILPKSAPMPAPIAMPRNGMKKSRPKSMPQNAPPMAPAPTRWSPLLTCGLPSASRTTSARVAQLHDHVLLQLGELETEPVGLHLVLEAEDHHFAHRLSCWFLLVVWCLPYYVPALGSPRTVTISHPLLTSRSAEYIVPASVSVSVKQRTGLPTGYLPR